jgi:hypothetical protein
MRPTDFDESNKNLTRPSGTTPEQCSSLPILQTGEFCISAWHGNWLDRLRFLFTGRMWLSVWSGLTQPPVKLTTDKPFEMSESDYTQGTELEGHAGEVQP